MNKPTNLQFRGVLTKDHMENIPGYTCPELGKNTGIADCRFDAYRLPSRMGSQLVYPKRQYGEIGDTP